MFGHAAWYDITMVARETYIIWLHVGLTATRQLWVNNRQ